MIQMNLSFKCDKSFRMLYSINVTKQRKPKRLTLSLFITFTFPIFREFLRRRSLL